MSYRIAPAIEVNAELEEAIEAAFLAQTGIHGMAVYNGRGYWHVEANVPRDDEVQPWEGWAWPPACCYCGLSREHAAGYDCLCTTYHKTWTVTDLGESWPRSSSKYARFYFEEV